MRIILISTPRAGSHARCSQFDNPLYECLSTMDLLLPRKGKHSVLNSDILSDDFNKALENMDWGKAYDFKPDLPVNHHILDYDENMQEIKSYKYPSKEYVLNVIQIRIDRLKLIDDWCVKVLRYHGLTQHHLEQLLNISDKTIKLQRRNKVDQCISQYLATYHNMWHNVQAKVPNINYGLFKGIASEITKDDIWINKFDQVTSEYYEDLDLSTSDWQKNNVQVDYDRQICSDIVNIYQTNKGQATNISESFEKELLNTDWSSCYDIISDTGYFKSITTSMDYWQVHMNALDKIGINIMNKDIQWLDVGVWFGVMPYIMQKLGFNNIDTTDCYNHRTSLDSEFQQLWRLFNLQPKELEVLPQQSFELNKTYDLITIFKSNLYWKTQDVIHYDGKTLNREWQTQGKDEKYHTYFTVYDRHDWDILFENLRKHLNPGGVAIINPEPWAYDSFENLSETKQWLERIGVYKEDYKLNKLSNYLVVNS